MLSFCEFHCLVRGNTGTRLDHVEEIPPVTKEHNQSNKEHGTKLALGVVTHKYEEWRHEIEKQVTPEKNGVMIHSFKEIDSFFAIIGIPYQHELVEPQICPENRNTKEELANIMEVIKCHILHIPQ